MLFQVGGQGIRLTFFEMAVAIQQLLTCPYLLFST